LRSDQCNQQASGEECDQYTQHGQTGGQKDRVHEDKTGLNLSFFQHWSWPGRISEVVP
jgi:hypothetical protein